MDAAIYIVCERRNGGLGNEIANWITSEYSFFDVKILTTTENPAPISLRPGDLVVGLLDTRELPLPSHPLWNEVRDYSHPPLIFVTFDATIRSGAKPFENSGPLVFNSPANDSDFKLLKRRIGAHTGLPGTKVFVSHASEDGHVIARQITDYLQAHDYPVFFDRDHPLGGIGDISQILRNHLNRAAGDPAGCLLLVDTPEAKRSDWVKKELQEAVGEQIVIIPVVWRSLSPGEPMTSRFEGMDELNPVLIRSRDPLISMAQEKLEEILAAMESKFTYEFKQKRLLTERARRQFTKEKYSWVEEDRPRLMFASESRPNRRQEDRRKVLSHVSVRSPKFLADLEFFRAYANKETVRGRFHMKFFIHGDRNLNRDDHDGLKERAGWDDVNQELIHWGDIRGTLNPNRRMSE